MDCIQNDILYNLPGQLFHKESCGHHTGNMIVKEFRIPMPLTVDEYKIGQLYTVMETSKCETGGGDGVEEVVNEPFTNFNMGTFGVRSGQYTQKKYYLEQKVPTFVRLLTPKGSLHLQEQSWNAYPYCKTILTNEYLNERLTVVIESVHLPDNGSTKNALNLPPDKLKIREVCVLDIAKDFGEEDEAVIKVKKLDGVKTIKTGRGPLSPNWYNNYSPIMCCYKVVTVEVKIFGLQGRMETFITTNQKRILVSFHRRMFLTTDDWHNLTIPDIRRLEIETKKLLDEQRSNGERRGTRAGD